MAEEGWTEDKIARLRTLWAQTEPRLSIREIARLMKVTHNAIIGKAHRLNLEPRSSPIRRGDGVPKAPRGLPVVPGARRRGSMAIEGDTLSALGVSAPVVVREMPSPVAPLVPVARPQPAAPAQRFVRASAPCCWPIGEPRMPGFRYCDAPGVPGRSYCTEHEAKAWVRVRAPQDLPVVNAKRARWGGLTAGAFLAPERL